VFPAVSIRLIPNVIASSFSSPHCSRLAVLNDMKWTLDMKEVKELFIREASRTFAAVLQ
jgi:hypothetical protein